MKKSAFILSMVVVLISVLTVMSFVVNATDMNTVVTFTIEATPTPLPTPTPEPAGPLYIINIPSSISLSGIQEDDYIDITWVNYGLGINEWVHVSIDEEKTLTDGIFYLRRGDGSTPSQNIPCYIFRSWTGSVFTSQFPLALGDTVVAEFNGELIQANASAYGRIYFWPIYDKDVNYAGVYTGTIHFKVEYIKIGG
jgi:hypothetical protein